MKDKKRSFKILSLLVVIALLLQLTGLFYVINEKVNSVVPLVDTSIMRLLTSLGGDAFIGIFVVLALFLEIRREKGLSTKTLAFLLALVTGLIIVALLKVLTAEPRPRPLPGANFLSEGAFPSGHTFRASIIASYVSSKWRKLAPIAWAYAVGIALTRLFLHYHWFSDVLFSLLFAPWLYGLILLTEELWLPPVKGFLLKLGLEVKG